MEPPVKPVVEPAIPMNSDPMSVLWLPTAILMLPPLPTLDAEDDI